MGIEYELRFMATLAADLAAYGAENSILAASSAGIFYNWSERKHESGGREDDHRLLCRSDDYIQGHIELNS